MKIKRNTEKLIRGLTRDKTISLKKLLQLKRDFSKKHGLPLLSNITLLSVYRQMLAKKKIKRSVEIENLLKRRGIRTLSGVSVITVLTKPYPCPGKCTYCPNEKGMPKSYLKNEPAAQRAHLNKFDPAKQVKMRLAALKMTGHPREKIEMIVLGGSWTSYPEKYKTWFIKRCFDACNKKTRRTLEQAQKINEKAKHRIIGLSLETRPDLITRKEADNMRTLGCTRVEIGVQSVYPEVLKKVNRGSSVEDIVRATKILKNYGFKITYHLMPNLPGSNPAKDLKVFKTIFSDERFQPDMLKIYPCTVLRTAKLYTLWKQHKYKPYSQITLNKLLIDIKKIIPPYVRINRLIRDIPSPSIEAGNKITNLRQLLQEQGAKCKCIRCREARQMKVEEKNLALVKRQYKASGGQEYFLSFESKDKKVLYAFLRLRLPISAQAEIPALSHIPTTRVSSPALSPDTAMIRELHTYGQSIPIKSKGKSVQHLGLGKRLMKEAENIADKKKYKKIAVISGIGVRDYYKNLGYKLEDTYMVKKTARK